MAVPGPWSVKGIDEETRDVARAAAERADMAIGAWIDRAILKAAGTATRPVAAEIAHAAEAVPAQAAESRTGTTGDGGREVRTPEPESRLPAPPFALEPPAASARMREFGDAPARPVAALAGDASPPRTDPLAMPPIVAHAELRRSADTAARAQGRGETLRYAIAGVVTLAAVAVGATYLDTILPPSGPDGQGGQVTAIATPAAPPGEPAVPSAPPAVSAPEPPAPAAGTDARVERLTALASAGDVAAQHELALVYSAGVDIPRDEKRAAEWFEKAAQQGFPPAQYNLGVLLEQGTGVERSAEKAYAWYKSAADQGYGRAQHNLGTLFATGNGVAQDYVEAAKWFARAADAGVAESLYSLGLMHEHGLGVARDETRARSLYQRASDAGVAEAARKLATLPKQSEEDLAAAARSAAEIAPAAGDAKARGGAADPPLDRKETAELQRLLQRLDFAPGSADGVAGRRTVSAIKLYQEFAGLPVDGKATRSLLEDIRQVSGALGRQPRAPAQ